MGGRRQGLLWLAGVLGWTLALLILLTPHAALALGWSLPGRGVPAPTPDTRKTPQRLQEVAPPEWVQQVQGLLEGRDPRVAILSPADGSLLPDAPWTLRLQVSDWPLVDAGPLGLGPHLVVQLDGQPPLPVVDNEVSMAPLSPGSHLLTVYAAKPWGEAHKSRAALCQVRLHRLAPNPATLPAPGTPQLLPVLPTGAAGPPPLLLDWLLIDAPLQGLRTESMGWRLRATLNGESVLLDRQTPLWLRGWQPGSNALLLELLDGRGDPLNPPFNSLLREVVVPTEPGPSRPHPGPLTPLEMAVLLGEQPPSALFPATGPQPGSGEGDRPLAPATPTETARSSPLEQEQEAPQQEPEAEAEARNEEEAAPDVAEEGFGKDVGEKQVEEVREAEAQADAEEAEAKAEAEAEGKQEEPGPREEQPPKAEATPTVAEPSPTPPAPAAAPPPPASPTRPPGAEPTPPLAVSALPTPPLSAREEVNADGTLKRPPRAGPLEGLPQRLQP